MNFNEPVSHNPLPSSMTANERDTIARGVLPVRDYWKASPRLRLRHCDIRVDVALWVEAKGHTPRGMGVWRFRIAGRDVGSGERVPYMLAVDAAKDLASAVGETQVELLLN